jgi:hypothetical protein
MRRLVFLACAVVALGTAPARAEDPPKDIKGQFLVTDYPAVTFRPGSTATIAFRVQNYNLPPERLELGISGVPSGWTATLLAPEAAPLAKRASTRPALPKPVSR